MNGLLGLAERLGSRGDYIALAFSLVICGAILIVVNVITHTIKERIDERRSNHQMVERHLTPLVSAASDLVSRIAEIIVFQRPSMIDALAEYDDSKSIEKLDPESLNRHLTTAYRLIKFLAARRAFQRATAGVPLFSRLRHVNYYLERKLPTAFKGNLYQTEALSKELQEVMGDRLLTDDVDAIPHVSVQDFCDSVNSGCFDHNLLKHALRFFNINTAPIKSHHEIDRTKEGWRQLVAMAHLGIYLIDFFQDLSRNPRWEEYRVFFAAMVLNWNRGSVAHKYLYNEGDMEPEKANYLDTYSERLVWHHPVFVIGSWLPIWPRGREQARRLARWRVLQVRGRRYIGAHPGKSVSSKGLVIGGEAKTRLEWTADLETLHDGVAYYLKMSGIVAENF